MKKSGFFKWFRDVSISKKLYFTVGVMAILVAVELGALLFSLSTLSSVRAAVGAEGLWSKAQKDAFFHLYKYGVSRNEEDYKLFKEFLKVSLGDSKTRIELQAVNPDWEKARQGFTEGHNHPDDIDGMINLFRRFNNIYYIQKAIKIWGDAEAILFQLIPIGEKLHTEINAASPSRQKINQLLKEAEPINAKLTVLENQFSYTLGEGSRWLEGIVLKLLLIIALTVEISGLLLAISVSRGIQKGLTEIISASSSFAKGNFKTRVKVFSQDEIGVVANSFNQMSGKLEQNINRLEQAQKRIKELLEFAPDAVITINEQGVITDWNKQSIKMFGWTESEVMGKTLTQSIIPVRFRERHTKGMEHFLKTGEGPVLNKPVEISALKKDNTEIPVELKISATKIDDSYVFIGFIRDITERKKAEEERNRIMVLEGKNKELEQFAYVASHDLQEPLRTISNYVGLFHEQFKGKLDKESDLYLDYITGATARMQSLIKGLLDYSVIGYDKNVAETDLNKLLKEVLNDMVISIQESNTIINTEPLPVLNCYPEIKSVFQNLISNAIKFRKSDTPMNIHITAQARDKEWLFAVSDNGIGIDKKHDERIFTIFQKLHSQKEYAGTGIGLAHCKKIIELHGGKIWVESELQKGSTFYFTIPKHTDS